MPTFLSYAPTSRRRALIRTVAAVLAPSAVLLAGCGRKGPLFQEEAPPKSARKKDAKGAAQ